MPESFNRFYKTRIAPTPSGFLHLGNVLSFAVTAALARQSGAKIMLRIDDLDRLRINKLFVQDIFDTLNFLEIPIDEGPRDAKDFEAAYSQVHRMPLYTEALQQLADNGQVFACTCSRAQLLHGDECNCFDRQMSLTTTDACWRLIATANPPLIVKTYSEDIVSPLPPEMQHFIVRKKDGFPAYQLTSIVDDLVYGVDLVIRGNDLWPSTLAQLLLASAMGSNAFSNITFYHHALLRDGAGEKLSKSAGTMSIKHLRESGEQATDIYRQIAAMLGSNQNITNWQRLATLALGLA